MSENCDCGHSFEDHKHESGLQNCKKCDCESAGKTEIVERQYGEEKSESNITRNILIGASSIIIIFLLINIAYPMHLIGIIWDADIENQLNIANDEAIKNDLDKISLRLTYDNKEETDMRIERAIDVFYNKYGLEDSYYLLEKLKDKNYTTIEFTWKIEQ